MRPQSPFGPDDEIGMLNMQLNESLAAAVLPRIDFSRPIYDLSVEYFVGMPSWTKTGEPTFQIWLTARPTGELVDDPTGVGPEMNSKVGRSSDAMMMFTHTGTHVDTLNHFSLDGAIWNGFTEGEHLGSRHWKVCGAEKHPPIAARGVLIDVAKYHGVDVLPNSYGIGRDDLEGALARQGLTVERGDVVIVRTGRMSLWSDPDRYIEDEPGLDLEGAKFLAERGAMMIGVDNLGCEQAPSIADDNWQVVHTFLLAESGIPIIEVVNAEELSRDEVYEFAFVGASLKLRGATGSPIRPLAFPLHREA